MSLNFHSKQGFIDALQQDAIDAFTAQFLEFQHDIRRSHQEFPMSECDVWSSRYCLRREFLREDPL